MFTISTRDIDRIIGDFGITGQCVSLSELQRDNYDSEKEVRLIVRAELDTLQNYVVRLKNENNVSIDVINSQSCFANTLARHGVNTPKVYHANKKYVKQYHINGYDVMVTVEEYKTGEIHEIDLCAARDAGRILARMHNIAEETDSHVCNEILFNPLGENELFSVDGFKRLKKELMNIDALLYKEILMEYEKQLQIVKRVEKRKKYAVQGDMSDCNLYYADDGMLGVFDFNRCGDSVLIYDAFMQAIYFSKLMNYSKEIRDSHEKLVLLSFFEGYNVERPVSDEEMEVFSALYVIVSAFWAEDILWADNSLERNIILQQYDAAHLHMKEILKRIRTRVVIP